MQRITRALVISLLALSVASCSSSRPLKWYDRQGFELVRAVKQVYSKETGKTLRVYHSGWAYKDEVSNEWRKGSEIKLYGLMNVNEQNDIVDYMINLVKEKSFNDVKLVFYDKFRFVENGNCVETQESKIMRIQYISKNSER